MGPDRRRLVLYARHDCHLCDEMQHSLRNLLGDSRVELRIEDVDSRSDWRRSYGRRVPVLTTSEGEELCHYVLDEARLEAWLARE